MPETPVARDVAAALADRERISWPDVERLAESAGERAIVRALRHIHALSAAPRETAAPARPLLPAGIRLALAAAGLQIAGGLAALAFGSGPARPYAVMQPLLLATFGAAAIVLAIGGRTDLRARWLMAFYALSAAAFAHPLLGRVSWRPANLLAALALDALMPYVLWRFVRIFPHAERFTAIDRAALWITRGVLVLGLALLVNSAAVAWLPPAWTASTSRLARSDASQLFWALLYVPMLAAFGVAAARTWHADASERQRVGLFALALVAGTAPLILKQLAESFGPASVNTWTHTGVQMRVVDAVVLGSLLAIPPATTYAVLVRRALSVRVVLHRATRYLLARASVAALAVLPAAALARYAFVHRDQPLGAIVTHGNGGVLSVWLAAAVGLIAARTKLLAIVDARFGGSARNRHAAVAAAIASIRAANGTGPIAAALANEIARGFGARASVLLLSGEETTPIHGDAAPLPRSSALGAVARAASDPLLLRDARLLALLPPHDRDWIAATGTEVLLPLHASDGSTIAIATIGPAPRGAWTSDDLAALVTLAQAAALALERTPLAHATAVHDDCAVECARCGLVAESAGALACGCGAGVAASLLPAVLNGKFAVEQRIGSGGMGVVYRGHDLTLDRRIALKTLPSIGPGAAQQMRGEGRAMASLIHPHLALIFGVDVWHRTPVLTMELLDGGTLAARLAGGALPIDDSLEIARALAGALDALHAQGLVHGDVKPSNIGFTRSGIPKLLDFGVARLASTGSSAIGGTPMYLPPEAFTGAASSPAFDLWALAVVLFEMIAGRHPLADGRLSGVNAPSHVADAVAAALNPDPARRPGTAAAFAAMIPSPTRRSE